ncbi:MAG: T9SS type A sorting domain-containing protein, partial [Flammeovirgaceae bacterium]|nr:T9SS type A sorting domain-containing protein [Flammeovirgaceae bacterium]
AVSTITVNGGCFFENPSGCTAATMVDISTGQPLCNPFIPTGLPQNLTPTTVFFNNVSTNCSTVTGIDDSQFNEDKFSIYPNPASLILNIQLPVDLKHGIIRIYNHSGQTVKSIGHINDRKLAIDISDLPNGTYSVMVNDETKMVSGKFVIQE